MWAVGNLGKLAVGAAIQLSAVAALLHAAPLFKEEGDPFFLTLLLNGGDPLMLQRSGSWAAFATDDDPVDAGEVDGAEIFKKGLDGEELHGGSCPAKGIDAGQAMFFVFDRDAPPDVLRCGRISEATFEKLFQACGTLGKNLIGVPVGDAHDGSNLGDVVFRNAFVEHVTHRIHKDATRSGPFEGLGKFLGNKTEIKTELEGVSFDPSPAFGKCLCVAMGATRADLGATANRVPSGIRPFDF